MSAALAIEAVPASVPQVVTLRGRCRLTETGSEAYCQMRYGPRGGIWISTDAKPTPFEQVICYIDGLGRVVGTVSAIGTGGFDLALSGHPTIVARIQGRLDWLAENGVEPAENRQDVRFVPLRTDTIVRLASGEKGAAARIVDVSRSGVHVAFDAVPEIGATVYVGRRGAKVVRHTEAGFAATFALPLSPVGLDETVVL